MKIKRIHKTIFNLLFSLIKGKTVYKQEILLKLALQESGIEINKLTIECDHILGKNYVNGIELPIKYPISFYEKAKDLIPNKKKYDFYFNGNMATNGKRDIMLKPFFEDSKSLIINSDDGRVQKNKGKFNIEYFSPFAESKFGLCPHQADWKGDKEYMWTYRFIESCFVEAIPIIFEDAPLGNKFINNFNYIWSNEVLDRNNKVIPPIYDKELATKNRELAFSLFCLTSEEINLIKSTF